MKNKFVVGKRAAIAVTFLLAFFLAGMTLPGIVSAQQAVKHTVTGETSTVEVSAPTEKASSGSSSSPMGLLAAAIAFGLGALGAGLAIGNVGAAAMGAIGEKPELAGQALIFVALAEGLVVFGFITALMILGRA